MSGIVTATHRDKLGGIAVAVGDTVLYVHIPLSRVAAAAWELPNCVNGSKSAKLQEMIDYMALRCAPEPRSNRLHCTLYQVICYVPVSYRANPSLHLFWAIAGGGGGTRGCAVPYAPCLPPHGQAVTVIRSQLASKVSRICAAAAARMGCSSRT